MQSSDWDHILRSTESKSAEPVWDTLTHPPEIPFQLDQGTEYEGKDLVARGVHPVPLPKFAAWNAEGPRSTRGQVMYVQQEYFILFSVGDCLLGWILFCSLHFSTSQQPTQGWSHSRILNPESIPTKSRYKVIYIRTRLDNTRCESAVYIASELWVPAEGPRSTHGRVIHFLMMSLFLFYISGNEGTPCPTQLLSISRLHDRLERGETLLNELLNPTRLILIVRTEGERPGSTRCASKHNRHGL
jgi:hypothetical protein